jgi:hypothetical protein
MNRAKLSKLVTDKIEELGMTQDQFAEYFSNIAKNPVTYGFVQSLSNPKKTSIPEYQNMRGIARMYNITLDELDFYLENDEIIDIKEIASAYKEFRKNTPLDLDSARHAIKKSFSPNELMKLGMSLIQDGMESMQAKIEQANKITEAFKHISLSQN